MTFESQRGQAIAIRVLLWLAIVAALLTQVSLLSRLRFDGENTGMESESLSALRDVASGQPLYRDYMRPPYILHPYMPFFYWTPGLLARATGVSGITLFVVGRVFTYIAWLGSAVLVWILTRQTRGSALAVALWLCGFVAVEWAASYRPDLPALCFGLAGVLLYSKGRPWAGVTLLVVAFFHKQSALAPLAAVLLEEVFCGRQGRMLALAGLWTLLAGLGILLCEHLSQGTYLQNVLGRLQGLAGWERPAVLFQAALVAGLPVFAAGVLSCLWPDNAHCPRLLRSYFMIALGWAVLTSMKFQSYLNYYLEPTAVGCVLTAFLVSSWLSNPPPGPRTAWIRIGWLGMATAIVSQTIFSSLLQVGQPPPSLNQTRVIEQLRPLGGAKLIEDPYLALRQDAAPFMIDVSQFVALQSRGKFDDRDIVHRIEAGQFTAIVTRRPLDGHRAWRFPARWTEPMRRWYVLADDSIKGYYIYLPHTDSK